MISGFHYGLEANQSMKAAARNGRFDFSALLSSALKRLFLAGACLGYPGVVSVTAAEPVETLIINAAETAGISGLPSSWDRRFPGGRTFDAAHRAVLLRFPGAADALAVKLRAGSAIAKAEIVLEYESHELEPVGYMKQSDHMPAALKKDPPRWHVVAWPLRRPWTAAADLAPTFNAFLFDAGYWAKYGARDTAADRFPTRLGPAELSSESPTARLDVTALLTEPEYGADAGARLRLLDEQGVSLQKWELYDARYHSHPVLRGDSYEWMINMGGNGITFKEPKLVATLVAARAAELKLPLPVNHAELAAHLKAGGKGGAPTAVMPTDEQIVAMADRVFRQPPEMPDWQWQRLRELRVMSNRFFPKNLESGDPKLYRREIDNLMGKPPRYWCGWDVPEILMLWYVYRELLPAPARDYVKLYWESQLMPDRPTKEFGHMQQAAWEKGYKYYEATRDWRGNESFFRGPYTRCISTIGFNHCAILGALLGGGIIGSEHAIADGRFGLENIVLRLWSWRDGSTQESMTGDYLTSTWPPQKVFADFGPTPFDRLIGQMVTFKTFEEVASAYHPGLRRLIYPVPRGTITDTLFQQSGLQHILHAHSRLGVHLPVDIAAGNVLGFPVLNYNGPPDTAAYQTIFGPWAPAWMTRLVDDKPLPFEMITRNEWTGLNRSYLGLHYGLASTDRANETQMAPVMAQWKRVTDQAQSAADLGTYTLNYWVNNSGIRHRYGRRNEDIGTLQVRNTQVIFMTPRGLSGRKGVTNLLGALAFFDLNAKPSCEWYIGDKPVDALPAKASFDQRLTMKDGVTYLGIIPLPASDLGRDAEVVLRSGDPVPMSEYGGRPLSPAFYLECFNRRGATELAPATADWDAVNAAVSGFVVEFGDASEYPSFSDFQKHVREAKFSARWEADAGIFHVNYRNRAGDDIAAGYMPVEGKFAYRRVNGKDPDPPAHIWRESPFCQISRDGRSEKAGAVLRAEINRVSQVQKNIEGDIYSAQVPLPDPTFFAFTVPGGIELIADGRVSNLRVEVCLSKNTLRVDYAPCADQTGSDMASALLAFGFSKPPQVTLNGVVAAGTPARATVDRDEIHVVPLTDGVVEEKGINERVGAVRAALAAQEAIDRARLYLRDWYVAGPFPYHNFPKALWTGEVDSELDVYEPETRPVNLADTFAVASRESDESALRMASSMGGSAPAAPTHLAWRRLLAPGLDALGGEGVDLAGLFGLASPASRSKPMVAYAYTQVHSDRDRAVTLLTGSDIGLDVWVNGEMISSSHIYRPAVPDQDAAPAHLRAGVNHVLLKISSGYEGARFYARLVDSYGRPIGEGIEYGALSGKEDE